MDTESESPKIKSYFYSDRSGFSCLLTISESSQSVFVDCFFRRGQSRSRKIIVYWSVELDNAGRTVVETERVREIENFNAQG